MAYCRKLNPLGGVCRSIVEIAVAALQSPLERSRPSVTRLRLVATLFGRVSNIFIVAIAAAVCGAAAWARGGFWLMPVLAAVEVTLVLTRCGVILAFQNRVRLGRPLRVDLWLVAFGGLAIASSLSWGMLCLTALTSSHDPVLYVIPVLSTAGMAGAIAARNSAVPRLAKWQLAFSLGPVIAGCMLTQDHGFRLLLLLVPTLAAGLVVLIAERNQQLVDLIETQAELARLSQTDALTLLPNRRYLDQRLEVAAAAATGRSSALLMADVDDFKTYNDRHGHPAGDALLRQIATILRQTLRGEHDVVARYGGEEFAILLEDADAAQAAAVGERLRSAVQSACRDPHSGDAVTISVGCAAFAAGSDPRAPMREADAALYRAKRAGRNCVESGDSTCGSAADRAAAWQPPQVAAGPAYG